MFDKLNINDFDRICRVCLYLKDNMLKKSTRQIIFMLEECTSAQEPKDIRFPRQICQNCYNELKTAYNFKQQCISSKKILCSIIEKQSKNIYSETNENKNANFINDEQYGSTVKRESLPDLEYEKASLECKDDENFISSKELSEDTKADTQLQLKLNSEFEIKENYENSDTKSIKSDNDDDDDDENDDNEGDEFNNEDNNESCTTSDEESKDENEEKQEKVESSDDNENHEGYERKQRSLADILLKKYKIYGLTCNICHKEISTRSTLLRHMEIHDKNRSLKYKCHICNKGFYAQENLKKHINRHEGRTKLQCDLCPKRFYVLSALGVHYKSSHKMGPQKCSRCPQEFYHPLQLEQHEQTHNEKKLICDVCGKVFPKKNKLTRHKKNHTQDRPYTCTVCNKSFKSKGSLQTHTKLRHAETDRREMCYICGKLMPVGTFTVHLETHKDRSVTCPHCNKIFANKIILERHVYYKHTDDGSTTKFYCKICNKALGSKGTLSTHMKVTHSEAKKIECHICGKAYKLVSHVNVHIKSAHMDIRPHICQTCFKAFHSKSELKNHMRTHTGERPFPCHICGKAFGFKTVLKTHMKVHSK